MSSTLSMLVNDVLRAWDAVVASPGVAYLVSNQVYEDALRELSAHLGCEIDIDGAHVIRAALDEAYSDGLDEGVLR